MKALMICMLLFLGETFASSHDEGASQLSPLPPTESVSTTQRLARSDSVTSVGTLSNSGLTIQIPATSEQVAPNTPTEGVQNQGYIPQHYDLTDEFHRETVCCFRLRRWVFQPLSVVLQLTAGGLVAGAEYCMNDSPNVARVLNGIGLGVGVSAFVINTLLLKIDNKLEDMDNYIMQRRRQ